MATLALDPWPGNASALVAPLGHATVVVDHFHAIKLANTVVDQARRRTQVTAAWQGKELLRAVYAAADLAAARAALNRFYPCCDGVQILELSRLARTVRAWQTEILAWHLTAGCSNGPTEAINLLIKKVKQVGHGFRNFANYRLRLLLHCGVTRQSHRAARLRSRSPGFVA